jgi:acyl carrier protein
MEHNPEAKRGVKRLILQLLSAETKQDYTDLINKVDVDVTTDMAVDSLNMVNIAIDLEDRLAIRIEDVELVPERLRSLDKFADLLLSKIAEREGAQAGRDR